MGPTIKDLQRKIQILIVVSVILIVISMFFIYDISRMSRVNELIDNTLIGALGEISKTGSVEGFETGTISQDGLLKFQEIVTGYYSGTIGRCEMKVGKGGYREITIYDEKRNPLYPKIGVWCEVSGDKIINWKFSRLQPFSRYDEEYNELWN